MKHLRLNNTTEFFREDLITQFLGNIKDINIIIGANNTRKSRFLRTIISQEFYAIYDGPDVLNREFHDSQTIFDELSDKGKDVLTEKLIQFQFHDTDTPGPKYTNIKDFFNPKSQIDFIDIKSSISNINGMLVTISGGDQFKTLQAIIQRTFDVTELLVWIFTKLKQEGLPLVKETNFSITNVKDVRYLLQAIGDQGISHFDLKLSALQQVKKYLEILLQLSFEVCDKSLIYIPVLRTSRMIGDFLGDVYGETILKQHFKSPTSKLKIETGLMLYEKIGFARNGTRKESRDFAAFEKFIGQIFFHSDDLHIVAHLTEKKEERNIKISIQGELDDISIYDIGDGVQAVINLLFPIFTAEDGSWVFIDEPENHLHPGYQNILMQTLSTHEFILNKGLRFFINTHSNHILSGALLGANSAEIMVFSRRDLSASNIQSFNGNEYHTLEKLGVLNTSVLISNCSVWVEGVTDRFYLQSFLYALCDSKGVKEFKPIEGLHFSFIEYGGKNLIHYEFDHEYKTSPKSIGSDNDDGLKNKIEAYFINANVFLLADSDFNAEKHKFFESIKRPNFKYCKTGLPEIENILPEEILKSYFIDELKCDKAEVLACFPVDHKVKLGKHFQNKITFGKGVRALEAESGGTLSSYYKKGLADFVHKKILDKTFKWNDLEKSEVLKNTVLELYKFINDKNGKL